MKHLFLVFLATSLFAKEDPFFIQTTHKITVDETPLIYSATVDSIPVRDREGKVLARLYYISYVEEDIDATQRPITFCFDGGPGGSSAGLQIGGLGPRRALTVEEGQSLTAPYHLIDNQETLLTHTDLVFIDPPGTGYSHVTGENIEDHYFYDTLSDIKVVGDFICDYLTREGRWLSPKYVAGCSYGTYRACGLASYLLGHGVALNGALLLSCAIDLTTLGFGTPNQENALVLSLPSFAAAAWFHKKFAPEITLEEVITGSRKFALEQLAPSLFLRGMVPTKFYLDLSFWTGLPLYEIQRCDGLIDTNQFLLNCCATEKKVISRNDGRITGDISPPRTIFEYIDPAAQQAGLLISAFQSYLTEELHSKIDWPRYQLFSAKANQLWRWHTVSTFDSLRDAMVINPEMRLFIGSGYFDLSTPFAATEYSFKRLNLSREDKMTFKYYEGGHGFFLSPTVLKQFKRDLMEFYTQ